MKITNHLEYISEVYIYDPTWIYSVILWFLRNSDPTWLFCDICEIYKIY